MRGVTFILMALLIIAPLAAITTYAWGQGHPDRCTPCHGAEGTATDTQLVDNAGNPLPATSFWDHNIQNGSVVWDNCAQCHNGVAASVANSVHANVGCRCHAVVHVGYNVSNQFFGAAFFWEATGTDVIKPTDLVGYGGGTLKANYTTFDETNYTTVLDANLQQIISGSQWEYMEVEVGLWQPYENKVISVGTADTYQTCFACHFIAVDPSKVGAYAVVGGKWKIGIPEAALNMPPHEIYPIQPVESSLSTESATPVAALIAGLAGVATVVIGSRARGV